MLDALLKSFISIFVVMNALGNVAIFSALNEGFSKRKRLENINRAVIIAGLVLLVFLFFGNVLFHYFGISINSFKIAGGIVLMIIGIEIVLGIQFFERQIRRYEPAVIPMATPLITGPGVITTVIILVGNYGYLIPLIASIFNLLITLLILDNSEIILRVVGKQGSDVISRIMGLIIVAIAVEFIKSGWIGI